MVPIKAINLKFTDDAFSDHDLKLAMSVIVDWRLFSTTQDRVDFASKVEAAVSEVMGKWELERL